MQEQKRVYIAIDLKSFYASVECVARGLDPLDTNLVVADKSRTDKTICLAVSPSLKAYGIGGRPRLFEVVQAVRKINESRFAALGHRLEAKSFLSSELDLNKELELDYIVAPPRMAHYIEVSSKVYSVYLRYVAPGDIHVYSIDEVFMDVSSYLSTYKMSARELTVKIIRDVLRTTGITATAGIGTNLYLCKVAMDIVAKHMVADKDGVRIGELDEMSYRRQLWDHKPLEDFWRVGRGTAKRLAPYGIDTMGKIARQSVKDEELLYKLFGVNAELLIDHSWGWEPCTMKEIKAYKPETNSLSSGQVLREPYSTDKAEIVLREMADSLSLDLVAKGLVTDRIVLTIGYDAGNLTNSVVRSKYNGEVHKDHYGREVPAHSHGTLRLEEKTSSSKKITEGFVSLFDRVVKRGLFVRKFNLTVCEVTREGETEGETHRRQLDLFTDYEQEEKRKKEEREKKKKERKIQEAQLAIKQRFGKNAILKGTSMLEGATAIERNEQIGGHKA